MTELHDAWQELQAAIDQPRTDNAPYPVRHAAWRRIHDARIDWDRTLSASVQRDLRALEQHEDE